MTRTTSRKTSPRRPSRTTAPTSSALARVSPSKVSYLLLSSPLLSLRHLDPSLSGARAELISSPVSSPFLLPLPPISNLFTPPPHDQEAFSPSRTTYSRMTAKSSSR